jgi:hypothetical protein
VLILTNMPALVAVWGKVWLDSVPLPKIPAFRNLLQKSYRHIVLVVFYVASTLQIEDISGVWHI